MKNVVWANGVLRTENEPVITAFNHGFTVGDGIFETIGVRNGRPFALSRHLARLQYSAERMGMRVIDKAQIHDGVAAVMSEGSGQLTRLRVTVTSGPGPMGTLRGTADPTVVVVGGDPPPPRTCHAVRAPWKRNERSAITGIKTTSYAENVVLATYADSKGADEAILSNTHGHLCEGTSTNIFMEMGGEIVTPPLASGCLPGIVRGLALEWGARAGIPVRVAAPGELAMAVLDEVASGVAFAAVTSAVRGVQMISKLDGAPVLTGPMLKALSELFESNAAVDPDPAPPRGNSG
ncbi:MAG: aminotransferase IV [Actinobacteria bacterium HGW-Actinobacteria-4]|nr:MAG: aminotransferase IV [Actinobacteria bacterium HGW-Actinobacteria-4]